jgi:hypothetical protein
MNTKKREARVAGLWYLAMAVSGPVGILYAPSQIRVAGDAAATTLALIEHQGIARVGVVAAVVCQIAFLFLVLALRRLFEGVDERLSRLMQSLVIAAVPIAVVNELLVLVALELATGAGSGMAATSRDPLVLALLDAHQLAVASVLGVFWGLWLFPFGLLAIRSKLIPPVLGALLMVGGATYLLDASLALLAPALRAAISGVTALPLAVGELSMVAWLLIKGVRGPSSEESRPSA